MMGNEDMNPMFPAVAEATEEAIVNALTASETMHGVRGTTVHALPLPELIAVMSRYGRPPEI
jgi:D-aminopeptidase